MGLFDWIRRLGKKRDLRIVPLDKGGITETQKAVINTGWAQSMNFLMPHEVAIRRAIMYGSLPQTAGWRQSIVGVQSQNEEETK